MQYIVMLLIVIGLAIADFITGYIKAYCKNDVCSAKMRKSMICIRQENSYESNKKNERKVRCN